MDYEIMMNGNVKIGMQAPEFEAMTTMGNISLNEYKGKWLVLFSHPGDFTPVCTTEIITFARANTYFNEKNTCLLGLSVDSNASTLAWLYSIYCMTGIKVPFPIISDRNGEIARKYGMISNEISNTETVRNVYIIDECGKIRAIMVYPMQVGRCIPEILRTIDALQVADRNSAATPANWVPGKPLIMPAPTTFDCLIKRNEEIERNKNGMSWFLGFKEDKCNRSIEENSKRKEIETIEEKKVEEKSEKEEKRNSKYEIKNKVKRIIR